MEPESGFRLDEYAAAIADEAFAVLVAARDRLPVTIRELRLTGMPGDIQATFLVVIGGPREYEELELRGPDTRIPCHVDLSDDDVVLAQFYQRHGYAQEPDGDEAPQWGDAFALPGAALIHELLVAAAELAPRLREASIAVADDCRYVAGDHDSGWTGADQFAGLVRRRLRELPEAQRADAAAMCYLSPAKRDWMSG